MNFSICSYFTSQLTNWKEAIRIVDAVMKHIRIHSLIAVLNDHNYCNWKLIKKRMQFIPLVFELVKTRLERSIMWCFEAVWQRSHFEVWPNVHRTRESMFHNLLEWCYGVNYLIYLVLIISLKYFTRRNQWINLFSKNMRAVAVFVSRSRRAHH